MSQEGVLWFQNLAEADPYGILPLGFLIPSLIGVSVRTFLRVFWTYDVLIVDSQCSSTPLKNQVGPSIRVLSL